MCVRGGGGGSSPVGASEGHLEALRGPGAGVVSGVNAASAAGSYGKLGSLNKSAPLPGKMEGRGGHRGDHSSPANPLPA